MNEASIATQITAILSNITGIKRSYDYDELPKQLTEADLPAFVVLIGPSPSRAVDHLKGGRASCGVDEVQDFILRNYIMPATQGRAGEAAGRAILYLSRVLDAFDARPHLVNADDTEANQDDFDYATAGVQHAFVGSHSGIVLRPYGPVEYFAIEFPLRIDGDRTTTKILNN